jgi:PHP family Zn ribbon phosphoesterase
MLREYNSEFVADAAELRLIVTNKLLDLSSCGDPRIEIKAAEMLGKISDVGLFSEKTEITVTYKSVSDIDEAIKDKIRKMMRMHAIDVPTTQLDVDKELGLTPTESASPALQDVEVISPAENDNDTRKED